MRILNLVIVLIVLIFTASCKKSLPDRTKSPELPAPAPTPDPVPVPLPAKYIETDPPILTAVPGRITNTIGGYYQSLPSKYDSLTDYKYPLIIFIHGAGQFGNGQSDLPFVLKEGIPKYIAEGKFPASFKVDSVHHSFIVIAPQLSKTITSPELYPFIKSIKAKYRIDTSRIYLAGFSMGGILVTDAAAEHPEEYAALVSMAGVSKPNAQLKAKCSAIVDAKLPVWVFHNTNDALIDFSEAQTFVNTLNSLNPAIPPKFTILSREGPLGHDAWTRATNPEFEVDGINIYEWMLRQKR